MESADMGTQGILLERIDAQAAVLAAMVREHENGGITAETLAEAKALLEPGK